MCRCHSNPSCFGCSHAMNRRRFVKGCGAALAGAGSLISATTRADQLKNGKVRVALVFLSKQGSSWPWRGSCNPVSWSSRTWT